MAKGMTIEQVKKAKLELELSVLKLVKDFESTTGTRITYIDTQRESDAFYDQPVAKVGKKKKKKGLKNVEINMELDVI